MLRQEVRQMRLEVERISRENQQIRELLGSSQSGGKAVAALERRLDQEVERLRGERSDAIGQTRSEIVSQISRQVESLAVQTEKALRALADAVEARPETVPTITFSDDYSREGVAYTIQRGDTLSGIARQFDSSVRDIQNANRIADPTRIQVGDTIFIPRKQE